jgi:pimeloyl-ACP methyl ester carboxylesterase
MASRERERPTRFSFSTRQVGFRVDGDRCVGTLYRPDRPTDAPVVVWGSSVPLARERGLAPVAEALAERGYAVYCFDPRGIGASGGGARETFAPVRQGVDWERAVARIRNCDGVDADRLAVAGHGFAGGHAVATAATDRGVDAVVAVAPVLDGRAFVAARPLSAVARALGAGAADRVGSLVGRERLVPAVGDAEAGAFVAAPAAAAAVRSLLPPGERIPEIPARAFLSALRHRPKRAVADVRCPTCFVAGDGDGVAPAAEVEAAAESVDDATFVRLPVDHFDVLRGRTRRAVADHVVAFLNGVLER